MSRSLQAKPPCLPLSKIRQLLKGELNELTALESIDYSEFNDLNIEKY